MSQTINDVLEQVLNDEWNSDADTWQAQQDIKDIFKNMVDELDLPPKTKELLKKKIGELE